MPEGLSTAEVGEKIAEHREHAKEGHTVHRLALIAEALLLSVVAMLAAWSGYSAAKWGSHSSLLLAKSSSAKTDASVASLQAIQIRTLDSVSFNAAESAFLSNNTKLFNLTLKRLRPGYRVAVNAWLALHPLKNPNAPPDPSFMPQYRIPQEAQGRLLTATSNAESVAGESAAGTADNYVRITVFLAAVLFIVGISSHISLHAARYGMLGVASALLLLSIVQLLGLPGPPA